LYCPAGKQGNGRAADCEIELRYSKATQWKLKEAGGFFEIAQNQRKGSRRGFIDNKNGDGRARGPEFGHSLDRGLKVRKLIDVDVLTIYSAYPPCMISQENKEQLDCPSFPACIEDNVSATAHRNDDDDHSGPVCHRHTFRAFP
jgi:hypothetical protein